LIASNTCHFAFEGRVPQWYGGLKVIGEKYCYRMGHKL
jgi:hypothetical protein